MSEQRIFHCTSCGYTGHETGWHVGHGMYACPEECKLDNGAYREMLEYDPADDTMLNAGVGEDESALAAVHEFQRKNRPMSDIGALAFDVGVLGMQQTANNTKGA